MRHAPFKVATSDPLDIIVHIRGYISVSGERFSALSDEVGAFVHALENRTIGRCSDTNAVSINSRSVSSSAETGYGRHERFYVAADNLSMISILHLHSREGQTEAPGRQCLYHEAEDLCRRWTSIGHPLEGYGCFVFGEGALYNAGNQASHDASKYMHIIGLPCGFTALLFALGRFAFLVLPLLFVGVLCTLDVLLQLALAFPDSFKLQEYGVYLALAVCLALSFDFGLFLCSRYASEVSAGCAHDQALVRSWCSSGRTVLISGTIMMVCNSSMYVVPDVNTWTVSASILVCCAAITLGSHKRAFGLRSCLRLACVCVCPYCGNVHLGTEGNCVLRDCY